MDLEEYKRLQQETELYRSNLENSNAEKLVIYKQYVKKLQECIQLEMTCIKFEIEVKKLKEEIESLKKEREFLQEKLNSIEESKSRMDIGD